MTVRGLITGAGLGLIAIGVMEIKQSLLIVPTPSLTPGIYWRLDKTALRRGDIVELSMPDAWVPYHTRDRDVHLLKRIVGFPGDMVCWYPGAMLVNGEEVGRRELHLGGRDGCQALGAHEMVIVGDAARSVDSRDLGPVDMRRIQYKAVLVWGWSGQWVLVKSSF